MFTGIVAAKSLPGEIDAVKLFQPDEMTRVEGVVVAVGGESREVLFGSPRTRVPEGDGEDPVLARFLERNELDAGDLDWDDAIALPRAILVHELLLAAREVVAALRKKGIAVAHECEASVGGTDGGWSDLAEFEGHVRDGLASLGEDARRDLAETCFDGKDRRDWLLALG